MIIVNLAIAVGLAYEYWRGAPLLIVLLCGVFLFVLAGIVNAAVGLEPAGINPYEVKIAVLIGQNLEHER